MLPSEREDLDVVLSEGQKLLELIAQVLEVSAIESADLELDLAPFDLYAAINETKQVTRFLVNEKNLTMDISVDADVPRMIHGDNLRLRQILQNLLNNAVKFTEEGGIKLRVHLLRETDGFCLRALHEDELLIQFCVEDSGIGLSDEDAKQIFDAFFQVDSSSTRKYGGAGLGLSIARRLVECMGGQIRVEQADPHGSIFTATVIVVPQKDKL